MIRETFPEKKSTCHKGIIIDLLNCPEVNFTYLQQGIHNESLLFF
jgi:hypothetical protein